MTIKTKLFTPYSISAVLLIGFFALFARASNIPEERIIVVGKKPTYLSNHDGILPVTVIDGLGVGHSNTMADMLNAAPEVNYSGQGGLLQTISIRGLSRWRIQTLVEGVPIHSERRAGNAAEFIAPNLVANAYVLSGAASTQLGSGALGGGIDLRLAATSDTSLNVSYGSAQDYRSLQVLGGKEEGNGGVYWGANFRHANHGADSLNQTLFNGFEQSVGWFRYLSDQNIKDALVIVSKANNVGKASSDLPEQRQTLYPDNDHWLAKLDFEWMN
ncbi:TonB-dependent receptor plug domain-containing protein, partial [Aliiglaciecola sp.]|nr:TonB-dependent receptor plug domain-containing protein [Aliiglaciecola sp.]